MARRSVRIALAGLAGLIVLAVIAGVVAVLRFDPNSLKPQIIAAVRQATGRELTLNGTVHLKPSLWPTVQLSDAALSNPPGFTGPRMATIQRLDLQLAIPPLLHHEVVIDSLVLEEGIVFSNQNCCFQGSGNGT